jgi:hypothetical protein
MTNKSNGKHQSLKCGLMSKNHPLGNVGQHSEIGETWQIARDCMGDQGTEMTCSNTNLRTKSCYNRGINEPTIIRASHSFASQQKGWDPGKPGNTGQRLIVWLWSLQMLTFLGL